MTHSPQLKEQVRELFEQGLSRTEIEDELELPKPTVARWLNPTLEEREREKARKRKFTEGKKCSFCKKRPMANRSTLCRTCYRERGQRRWTEEKLIEAVRVWALEHGNPPAYQDWQSSGGESHPAVRSITEGPHPPFKKWSDLLRAAGFEPGTRRNKRGKLTHQQKLERAELRRQLREQKIKQAVQKGEQHDEERDGA